MIEQRTDEELVAAYLSGEKSAFEHLVNRYQERLIRFAREKVKRYHDAEDAVQETWLKVWQNLNNIEDTRKFSSYLYRVCTNECFNIQRERKRERFTCFSQLPGASGEEHLWQKNLERLKPGAFRELAESMVVRDRILAVLNHEEHRLWYCVVTRGRKYEAICQDEKLFRDKTEEELRQKFGEVWRKVWQQRNKEVAKWMPKKKPQMDTD